ncbi:MAG: gamma-glutamylcyclotransferase [Bacillaceae bacterium]|nr:gamma-glutamylcyclotransferase [Bacillaceae bacterium]
MSHLVFVYGSLRRGEKYHHILSRARCVAEQAWTQGRLYDTGNGYPAMTVRDSSDYVYGELYRVDDQTLARIDELEGYTDGGRDNLYDRKTTTVLTDTGENEAVVYTAADRDLLKTPVPYGDWKYALMKQADEFLYFAYGSCMDDDRFRQQDVVHLFQDVEGRGVLHNYVLRFTHRSSSDGLGRADIVEEKGGMVEGKVYRISHDALRYLEWREGVSAGAYRPSFVNIRINGEKQLQNVFTFVVKDKQEEMAPPREYAEEIVRGASTVCSSRYVWKLKRELKERFGMDV